VVRGSAKIAWWSSTDIFSKGLLCLRPAEQRQREQGCLPGLGQKEGRSQPPRSLGIFYVDDSTQDRWVLKFEDPDVLEQIDQVFVTVEPASGSKQPTGRPFLSAAFLNEPPNHP